MSWVVLLLQGMPAGTIHLAELSIKFGLVHISGAFLFFQMASFSPEAWFPHSIVILGVNPGSYTTLACLSYSVGQTDRSQSLPVFEGGRLPLGKSGKGFVAVFNLSHSEYRQCPPSAVLRITSVLHVRGAYGTLNIWASKICGSIVYGCPHLSQPLTLGISLPPTLSLSAITAWNQSVLPLNLLLKFQIAIIMDPDLTTKSSPVPIFFCFFQEFEVLGNLSKCYIYCKS